MVMKVGGDGSAGSIGGSDRASSRPGVGSASTTSRTSASRAVTEEVKVSANSIELADKEAPLDASRVSAISQAIREGRFQVDANKVAEKLIEGVRELTGQKTG
jgi:negative regulator of flagellin synthesis FlgM